MSYKEASLIKNAFKLENRELDRSVYSLILMLSSRSQQLPLRHLFQDAHT